MKQKTTAKRMIAVLLTLAMALSVLPMTVFAEEPVSFNKPSEVPSSQPNGITATVTEAKLEGIKFTAKVTFSGTATVAGLYTVALLSEASNLWCAAQDIEVEVGDNISDRTFEFVFPEGENVPTGNVTDLTLDYKFAVPADYTLYLYEGKGYQNASDGLEVDLKALKITPQETGSGYKYTFDSVNIVSTKREGLAIGGEFVTLELVGDSTIKGGNVDTITDGMSVTGNLTVEGEGSLNVFAGNTTLGASVGIRMNTGSFLTVNGGSIMSFAGESSSHSYGVEASSITVNDGSIRGFGGAVTSNAPSIGIYVYDNLTVNGGNVEGCGSDVAGENGVSFGIFLSAGNLAVNDGTVRGYAASGKNASRGIWLYSGNLTVNGGSVEGYGGSGSASYGAEVKGDLTLTGGTIKGTGDQAASANYGICARGNVTVDDGRMEGAGGQATYESCGLRVVGDFMVNGGSVFAKGGEAEDSIGLEAGSATILGGEVELSGDSLASGKRDNGLQPVAPVTKDAKGNNVMNVIAGANAEDTSDITTDWAGDGSDDVADYQYMFLFGNEPDDDNGDEPSVGQYFGFLPFVVDNPFIDVSFNDWFFEPVNFVYANKLMVGTSKWTFDPNTAITRGMLTTILARLNGVNTNAGRTWYEAGMNWALGKGLTDKTDALSPISREEIAVMLYRNAGSPAVSGDLSRFSDANSISAYAKDAMLWAVQQGIFAGMGNGILAPQGNATRAQVATILQRLIKK